MISAGRAGPPPRFSGDTAACLPIGEHAVVMLLSKETFAQHAHLPAGDPSMHTQGLYGVGVSARDEVYAVADAALAAGATEADGPEDHGFMYTRSFFDLDGYGWQVTWVDPAAQQGTEEPAA